MPERNCLHGKSHFEDWPDGGQIEVCDLCGMSRYHWEWGESAWIVILDIPTARQVLQDAIDEISGKVTP